MKTKSASLKRVLMALLRSTFSYSSKAYVVIDWTMVPNVRFGSLADMCRNQYVALHRKAEIHSPASASTRQHDEIRIFSGLIANTVVGYDE